MFVSGDSHGDPASKSLQTSVRVTQETLQQLAGEFQKSQKLQKDRSKVEGGILETIPSETGINYF